MNYWILITGALSLLTFGSGLFLLVKDYHYVLSMGKGKFRVLFPDIGLIICSLLWAGLAVGLFIIFQNQSLMMTNK